MAKTVTLKEIAERAGVSPMTVSHVLRDTGRISAQTRERVQQVANKLGHRPNASAQSMRSGRYGNVALVLSTDEARSAINADVLKGVHRALARERMHLSMAELDDNRLSSDGYMSHILQSLAADGLLLNYKWRTPPELLALIREFELPAVWVADRYEFDSVYPDLYHGMREAIRRLVDIGHRRIAYAGSHAAAPPDTSHVHYSVVDCESAYADAMTEAGLQGDLLPPGGVATLLDTLRQPRRPTALVCRGIHFANFARLAASEAGLNVPRDLSIVPLCHDARRWLGLPFAQVLMPSLHLGEAAVDMLVEKIANPTRRIPSKPIPMPWRDGPTLAAPRCETSSQ